MNHLKDMDVEVKNWNSAVGNVDNKAKESIRTEVICRWKRRAIRRR
jgi:hypothetical protein